MKVIGKKVLKEFALEHSDSKKAIQALVAEIEKANWKTPHDIKLAYPKASIVGNNNVIFNICGNKYRAWLKIAYQNNIALINKIGTHSEYDGWEIK